MVPAVNRAISLDVLRIFAAFWVLAHHWTSTEGFMRSMLFAYSVPYLWGPLQFVIDLGYLGVDVFFIISGIVIGRSAIGRDWSTFGVARFLRLYPAYVVATVLTMVLAPFSLATFPAFSETWLSLFGLQWFFGGPTLIGPAWTLFIEIRFYLLIAVALFVFGQLSAYQLRGLAKVWLLIVLLAPSLQLPWVHFAFISDYGSYFILGMLLGLCRTKAELKSEAPALCVAFIAAWVRLDARLTGISGLNVELLIGSAILLGVVAVAVRSSLDDKNRQDRAPWITASVSSLALMSYPIYLIHEPLGMPLLSFLQNAWGGFYLPALVSLGVVLLVCYLIVSNIEPALKSRLKGLLIQPTMELAPAVNGELEPLNKRSAAGR